MTRRIHQMAIGVPDIDDAVEFYCEELGFDFVGCSEGVAWSAESLHEVEALPPGSILLQRGSLRLALVERREPDERTQEPANTMTARQITKLSFTVGAIFDEYERLQKAGVSFDALPREHGDAWIVRGIDPAGNVIELQEQWAA